MILPGLILVSIYSYGPMIGLVMAFQDYDPVLGFFASDWVGLENFQFVFSLPNFSDVFWNTVSIAVLKIIAGLVVPITIAILLNEIGKSMIKRSVQTLIYLPHFLSWVILGGILIDILSPSTGIVSKMLTALGINPPFFLGDNNWFPSVLVASNTWKEFGFSTIVYLAAISGINQSLYEAAAVDGAKKWRQIWHITLPGMRPIIILMATLSLGSVLNAGFDQVFNLYSPIVYESGDIIDTFVYRLGLLEAQYGVATAIGLFQSIISFGLISLSYFLAYRWANYRIF
ncbi:ABC transporter permease subunit [Metabacillus sp. cB07]|uniref:ABC transporter permease n=1 Tax=Metabacillus sp. cB07 TaxID=2806989 RepID=UPI00193940CA|nr:ABC transporter permease subunit [Metabacillus sp. cB07]